MNYQMSLFDNQQEFHNENPIRLIELFAGYGSQALALKYLDVSFEHYRISEWATKSIQAYKDMHFKDDNTDYSKDISTADVKTWLLGRISADYNTPMTEQQINRLSEKRARRIYNNMQATHNLGSITTIKADDLAIVDTDKFCYIMTYSFPCQDLSQAGKGAGMTKGNGTRSGLLWEVERLLTEISNGGGYGLPQILLMENVPQVIGRKSKKDFSQWLLTLESLGYQNYLQILNAKDYSVPQNRERCFMLSLLGEYKYSFPNQQELTIRLKDFLDRKVDEKYYLPDKTVEMFMQQNRKQQEKGNGFRFEPTTGGGLDIQSLQGQEVERATILLSNKGTKYEKTIDCASTLMARDYKGFGNQSMTAIIEKKTGGGRWNPNRKIPKFSKRTAKRFKSNYRYARQ